MAIIDTGFLTVADNAETLLVVPKGKITQARVRWRGRSAVQTQYDTTSASDSGSEAANDPTGKFSLTAPDNPGWTLDEVSAHSSLSQSPSDDFYVYVQAPGESAISKTGNGTSWSLSQDSNDPAPNRTSYHSFNGFSPYNWSASCVAHWHRHVDLFTHDPQITVATLITAHVGTLANGEVSAWYPALGFAADATNTIRHDITGGAGTDVQIEITYTPALTVTLLAPAPYGPVTRAALVFHVVAVPPAGSVATIWYPEIRADRDADLGTPEFTWCSKDDQVDWEYWNGAAWVALPAGGAPIDAECRFTPPAIEMAIAKWYWSGRGWDDETEVWGAFAATWQFRLRLTVEGRFALEIDGRVYTTLARNCRVFETTNGELGQMSFNLVVQGATILPEDGDSVILGVKDVAGNVEQFEGWTQGGPDRLGPQLFQVNCKLPDSLLAEHYILVDYPSQDVGLTFKAIVDSYYTLLVSSGINVTTGFVRPITALGRTALDIGKQLREEYGLLFWVTSTDSVVHLIKPADIDPAVLVVARGLAA